ncbi:hypothetical protein BDK51DRAFT_33789 [Blyttiomyces helicus]|uniref:Uncharacterized protein n=1 Tax=Blyttiomyces helicus TaxID=388810 RepID=A0A4P9WA13_9FUNG|nr:hypothetical protein BDK51DRAFT_33789 [Blyttiomyces helicus]|eukprot:RKO89411.1 hypothetical protein BDK51DRAFT_33789 [Blyttiomyces helicus]
MEELRGLVAGINVLGGVVRGRVDRGGGEWNDFEQDAGDGQTLLTLLRTGARTTKDLLANSTKLVSKIATESDDQALLIRDLLQRVEAVERRVAELEDARKVDQKKLVEVSKRLAQATAHHEVQLRTLEEALEAERAAREGEEVVTAMRAVVDGAWGVGSARVGMR